MSDFTDFLVKVDDLVWGIPLIVLILAAGIYLTFRLRLLQIVHLPKALKYMFKNEEDGHGEVSSFGALCTALSATIGTGNIVGVATAIGCTALGTAVGGPGALFWMWVAALLEWLLSMQKDFWQFVTELLMRKVMFLVDRSIT